MYEDSDKGNNKVQASGMSTIIPEGIASVSHTINNEDYIQKVKNSNKGKRYANIAQIKPVAGSTEIDASGRKNIGLIK